MTSTGVRLPEQVFSVAGPRLAERFRLATAPLSITLILALAMSVFLAVGYGGDVDWAQGVGFVLLPVFLAFVIVSGYWIVTGHGYGYESPSEELDAIPWEPRPPAAGRREPLPASTRPRKEWIPPTEKPRYDPSKADNYHSIMREERDKYAGDIRKYMTKDEHLRFSRAFHQAWRRTGDYTKIDNGLRYVSKRMHSS